jgi:hypothetical protein
MKTIYRLIRRHSGDTVREFPTLAEAKRFKRATEESDNNLGIYRRGYYLIVKIAA